MNPNAERQSSRETVKRCNRSFISIPEACGDVCISNPHTDTTMIVSLKCSVNLMTMFKDIGSLPEDGDILCSDLATASQQVCSERFVDGRTSD